MRADNCSVIARAVMSDNFAVCSINYFLSALFILREPVEPDYDDSPTHPDCMTTLDDTMSSLNARLCIYNVCPLYEIVSARHMKR